MSRLDDKDGRFRRGVLIVGAGGLGAAAALELARLSALRIGLVDGDRVEASNLHRQLLHGPADLGRPKVEVAAEKLRKLRPSLEIETHAARLTDDDVGARIAAYDFVIDATDHAPTKFLLNDACVRAGKPFVYAGVVGLRGQLLTVLPRESACLRCLFPEAPAEDETASCQDAGILGPLVGLVGALEAREAVKCLTGTGTPASDRLLTIDAASLRIREVPLRRSPACPACGPRSRSDSPLPGEYAIHEAGHGQRGAPGADR